MIRPHPVSTRPATLLPSTTLFRSRAGTSVGGLGLLDLAPVVVIGRHHVAGREKHLQPFRAFAFAAASGGHGRFNLRRNFITVGAVGPDRPDRKSTRLNSSH